MMMRVFITIGIATIFAVLGTAVVCWPFGDNPPVAVAFVVTLVTGIYTGNRIGAALEYKPARSNKRTETRLAPNAAPFLDRLARFAGRTSTGGGDYESKMPLWVADIKLERTPARSPQFMRSILNRIRAILSRDSG